LFKLLLNAYRYIARAKKTVFNFISIQPYAIRPSITRLTR